MRGCGHALLDTAASAPWQPRPPPPSPRSCPLPHTDRDAVSDEIETLFLDAYGERAEELFDSQLDWQWQQDPAASDAFDRMCAVVIPGSTSWERIEEDLDNMAEEYPDHLEYRAAELGEQPSSENIGRWLFSRAATLPAAGTPAEVGEWIHAGTGQHEGVSFTAFVALGVSEHFGMALLSDNDGDWAIPFSPV